MQTEIESKRAKNKKAKVKPQKKSKNEVLDKIFDVGQAKADEESFNEDFGLDNPEDLEDDTPWGETDTSSAGINFAHLSSNDKSEADLRSERDERIVAEYTHGQKQTPDFDIFEYSYNKCLTMGDLPKFRIHKDNSFLTEKIGRFSITQLQKQYGGGTYSITAKRASTNDYLKHSTVHVADLPTDIIEDHEKPVAEAAQASQIEIIVRLVKEMMGENKSAQVAEIQAKSNKEENQMGLIVAMMQQQNQSQLEMMKMQQQESKQFLMMMMQQMNQKPVDNGLKPMELISLLTNQKAQGAKEFKDLFHMAKELASDMNDNERENSADKKESSTDVFIKSAMPVLGALLGGGSSSSRAQALEAEKPEPAQPQRQAPIRAPLNPGLSSRPSAPLMRPVQTLPPVPKPEAITKPSDTQTSIGRQGGFEMGAITIVEDEDEQDEDNQDIDSFEGEAELAKGERYVKLPDEGVLVSENEARSVGSPKPKKAEVVSPKVQVTGVNLMKDRIIDLITPKLVQAVVLNSDIKQVAKDSWALLAKNGITTNDVTLNFKEETLLGFAKEKGMPEKYGPWLKEFYAEITKIISLKNDGLTKPGASRNLS